MRRATAVWEHSRSEDVRFSAGNRDHAGGRQAGRNEAGRKGRRPGTAGARSRRINMGAGARPGTAGARSTSTRTHARTAGTARSVAYSPQQRVRPGTAGARSSPSVSQSLTTPGAAGLRSNARSFGATPVLTPDVRSRRGARPGSAAARTRVPSTAAAAIGRTAATTSATTTKAFPTSSFSGPGHSFSTFSSSTSSPTLNSFTSGPSPIQSHVSTHGGKRNGTGLGVLTPHLLRARPATAGAARPTHATHTTHAAHSTSGPPSAFSASFASSFAEIDALVAMVCADDVDALEHARVCSLVCGVCVCMCMYVCVCVCVCVVGAAKCRGQ